MTSPPMARLHLAVVLREIPVLLAAGLQLAADASDTLRTLPLLNHRLLLCAGLDTDLSPHLGGLAHPRQS